MTVRLFFAALLVMAASGCSGGGESGGALPPDGFLSAWKTMDRPATFRSDALYGRIDGGAEVFLELGFERLDVQEYQNGEVEIGVEIYWMSDEAAAQGIYLMKCGRETPSEDLAERHTVNPQQLLMCKGAVYCTVTRLDGAAGGDESELVAFAEHVAGHLSPGKGAGVFDVLPEGGRIRGTERVIRGPFTLQSVYTLGEGDILKLRGGGGEAGLRATGVAAAVTAVAAQYDGGAGERSLRIVADYSAAGAAQTAFRNVRDNLDPYLEVVAGGANSIDFRDFAGQLGCVRVDGSRLIVTVSPPR